MAPGQRLVEEELAGTLGVTRASLRAALFDLTAEGLVERIPNRGARVRTITIDEAVAITECRMALEGLCAAKAAELVTETQASQLRQLGAELERCVEDPASEEELVRLAVSIAERVVGRELETDPTLVVAWARDCIEQLGAKDGIVVAFAKDVREQVPAVAWADLGHEHRTFVDVQLAPGSVEVRTPEGTIAAGADARLAAVTGALGLEES